MFFLLNILCGEGKATYFSTSSCLNFRKRGKRINIQRHTHLFLWKMSSVSKRRRDKLRHPGKKEKIPLFLQIKTKKRALVLPQKHVWNQVPVSHLSFAMKKEYKCWIVFIDQLEARSVIIVIRKFQHNEFVEDSWKTLFSFCFCFRLHQNYATTNFCL